MKLLQWISFGSWENQPIMPDDYIFVKTMVIIFMVSLVFKVFGIFCMDCEHFKKDNLAKWFTIGIRILQAFLYVLIFCILGLFHTPDLYWLVVPLVIYYIVIGIVVSSGDMKRYYIYKVNENLKDLCKNTSKNLHDGWDIKKQCKKLNKKINDYQKTAIIG